MDYWGHHLILDCGGCDRDKITDRNLIDRWIRDLVKRIDMVAHGEPVIEFNGAYPNHCGYSVVQIITTSSITAHFIDNLNQVYLDVFSCKDFDVNIIRDCMKEYFNVTSMRQYYLTRQAD